MVRPRLLIALSLNLLFIVPMIGCVQFNKPLLSDGLFVVGATSSPKLSIYRLASDRNSFTLLKTYDPTYAVSILGTTNHMVAFGGANKISVIQADGTTFSSTFSETTVASLGAVAVSQDRASVYLASNATILRRTITNGVVASTNSQSKSYGLGEAVTSLLLSEAGDRLFAGDDGSIGDVAISVFAIDQSGTISDAYGGGLLGAPCTGLVNLPGLGTQIFAADTANVALGTRDTVLGIVETVNIAGANTHIANHPTQPWVYSLTGTALRQYSVTASSITLATSIASTANAGIAVSSEGDRLATLSTTGALALYSIGSTGAPTLIQTTSLTNSPLAIKMMPLGRR